MNLYVSKKQEHNIYINSQLQFCVVTQESPYHWIAHKTLVANFGHFSHREYLALSRDIFGFIPAVRANTDIN